MRKTLFSLLLPSLLIALSLSSCEHEIDFDYPTAESTVVFEGRISNEDVFVRISRTRTMDEATPLPMVDNAQVWIADDEGGEEQLYYDKKTGTYRSASGLAGVAGHTYRMRAVVDGRQYEAHSTMQLPAPSDTVGFRYIQAVNTTMFFVRISGLEPIPGERNYYLVRLMRGDEVFRWSTRSGRGNENGRYDYDIMCSSDDDMKKEEDDDGKRPLKDGDTINVELMSIDRESWEYYLSLSICKRITANPITNIEGGALGVFMAANIERPDTLVFNMEEELKK